MDDRYPGIDTELTVIVCSILYIKVCNSCLTCIFASFHNHDPLSEILILAYNRCMDLWLKHATCQEEWNGMAKTLMK